MNRFHLRLVPATAMVAVVGFSVVKAATPLPPWYGEPGTTRQAFYFGTGSLDAPANLDENPYATPVATVVQGIYGDGWQDPADPIDLNGVTHDGAWDLGINGSIVLNCPVAAAPPATGGTYRIDFEVYAVAYSGITALPLLDTLGLTANDLALSQALVAPDPQFPGASWQGRAWTGYFDDVTTQMLNIAIKAPSNNTTIIDSFEVFTKVTYVPEPAVGSLALWAGALLFRRRRGAPRRCMGR